MHTPFLRALLSTQRSNLADIITKAMPNLNQQERQDLADLLYDLSHAAYLWIDKQETTTNQATPTNPHQPH